MRTTSDHAVAAHPVARCSITLLSVCAAAAAALLLLLQALSALAEVAPDQLGPYSPALAQLLLAEASGGRLWEGKEALLACLGGLGAACAATLAQQPGEGVCGSGCSVVMYVNVKRNVQAVRGKACALH